MTDITINDVTEFYKRNIGNNRIMHQTIINQPNEDIELTDNMFTDLKEIELERERLRKIDEERKLLREIQEKAIERG